MSIAMSAMMLVLSVGATLALAAFALGLIKDFLFPKWYDSGISTRIGNLFFGLLMIVGVVLMTIIIYLGVTTSA